MVEPWIFLMLAAIVSLASFAWLALAMDAHWKQVQPNRRVGHPKRALRFLGWLGLLTSATLCFLADRPSMAILVWIMLLAATAPSIAMMLSWQPKLLRIFWLVR